MPGVSPGVIGWPSRRAVASTLVWPTPRTMPGKENVWALQ
jgi:hypothetical protein